MGKDLYIAASVEIAPAIREEFLALTKGLVAESSNEEGNIFYTLNEIVDKPGSFLFVEHWKSQEAIDIHGKTAHFQNFVQFAKDKSLNIVINIAKPV